jgi:Flp pilus assembly protein TadG
MKNIHKPDSSRVDPEELPMISVVDRDKNAQAGLMARMGGLLRDRRGSGAIEFAIIAPILLMIYVTCFELTIGLSVSKRMTRAAASVADIVTQEKSWVKADLPKMVDVASALLSPYAATGLTMKISGITVSSAKKATIAWSWAQDGTKPYVAGAAVTVPTDMNYPDTFLVRTEVSIPHKLLMFLPGLLPAQAQTISIRRESYYRNRLAEKVLCDDC